jgi:DNA-binding Xre family transcriptional regulator/predicted transcriptional regulator
MEHSLYLKGIKTALHAKGLTYAVLAPRLKMTESGVKKMMNAKDISFRRVLQICDTLDILPGQLFSLSEKTSIREITLTPKQQDALIKNRDLLAVYWLLTVEKCGVPEIERRRRLGPADVKRLLQKLVGLDLVVRHRGGYRPKHGGKFKWSDTSKLAKTLNREWSQMVLRNVLSENPKEGFAHRLVAMKLSERSYRNLVKNVSETFDAAAQTSEREELTLNKDLLRDFTALTAFVPLGVFDLEREGQR